MQFEILENFKPKESVEKSKEKVKPTSPDTTKKEQPKLPYARISAIINGTGYKLTHDNKKSIDAKLIEWVETLRWLYPLIPDEHQTLKVKVRGAIDNPSPKDFTLKP